MPSTGSISKEIKLDLSPEALQNGNILPGFLTPQQVMTLGANAEKDADPKVKGLANQIAQTVQESLKQSNKLLKSLLKEGKVPKKESYMILKEYAILYEELNLFIEGEGFDNFSNGVKQAAGKAYAGAGAALTAAQRGIGKGVGKVAQFGSDHPVLSKVLMAAAAIGLAAAFGGNQAEASELLGTVTQQATANGVSGTEIHRMFATDGSDILRILVGYMGDPSLPTNPKLHNALGKVIQDYIQGHSLIVPVPSGNEFLPIPSDILTNPNSLRKAIDNIEKFTSSIPAGGGHLSLISVDNPIPFTPDALDGVARQASVNVVKSVGDVNILK